MEDELEERISREAWSRVTDEDLRLAHTALKRWDEEGGEPTGEEQAALRRFEELREEVRRDLCDKR